MYQKVTYGDLTIFYKINDMETYPPFDDSFLLAEYVKLYSKGKKVLDLGCGSGIQGLIAYKYGTRELVFSDIDKEALVISKVNFIYNFLDKRDPSLLLQNLDKYKFKNVKFICSDLFSNISGQYDLIIFNPPYLPEEGREDTKLKRWVVGGKRGYEIILKFLMGAKNYLKTNGKILLVYSSLTNKEVIEQYMKKLNYRFRLLDSKKFFWEEIYVYLLEKE